MITRQNLHMHSTYDDGKDSCECMLSACMKASLASAGISLHSPLPFQNDWAAASIYVSGYLREMASLKCRFGQAFQVYTGIEWDVLSDPAELDRFDYVIGSVHHLPVCAVPPSVDNTPEETAGCIQKYFGGDADAAATCYFNELLKVASEPRVSICGHFDLLLKFNERMPLFNPESPAYIKAGQTALDALLDAGKIIEVNTGAISRGWRSTPYPEAFWLHEIARRGGSVLISSDAHSSAHVVTGFDAAEALLISCGFDHVMERSTSGAFQPVPLGKH